MKMLSEHITLVALLICLLITNSSAAKNDPLIETIASSESSSLNLTDQICGGCDDPFDKSVCDFSGDICTELLTPLDLDYTHLGCLEGRTGDRLAEASMQDIAKLTAYLFRVGQELTCEDLDFLTNSQILDGVNVVTLTEVISELFERGNTADTKH